MSAVNRQIPNLALGANGSNVPPVVEFGSVFALALKVQNTGEFSAEHIVLDVSTAVPEVDTLAKGWEREAPGEAAVHFSPDPKDRFDMQMNHFVTGAARSLAAGETFMAPTLYFTNVMRDASTCSMFPVTVTVHADRSKAVRAQFLLISPRKGGGVNLKDGVVILN